MGAAYALIRGLQSQQAEPKGWNAVVQASLRPWHVIRVSNESLEVLLPEARRAYDMQYMRNKSAFIGDALSAQREAALRETKERNKAKKAEKIKNKAVAKANQPKVKAPKGGNKNARGGAKR